MNKHLRITISCCCMILLFSLLACTGKAEKATSPEEEAFFVEVVKRREQGRDLINRGLLFSNNDSCKRVYKAISQYYERTDELFTPLLEKYPSLQKLKYGSDSDDISLTDTELVELLQLHVYATLNLYKNGVLKDINDQYKKNLLVLIPALLLQNEDLEVLLSAYEPQKK